MKPFLDTFKRSSAAEPKSCPVWLMRQAGRYLPEYREIRGKAPSFLDFCYTPDMAIEATLQPIRRFGFDAAIIFSDILVIPDALGQGVRFAEGEGPRLDPIETPDALDRLATVLDMERLQPVYEAISGVRSALTPETALIGFCGAPWTLATYMIAGRGTPDQAPARLFAYRHPEAFSALIDRLVEACIQHLGRQIEAGADAVQIFDSWAGTLPERAFLSWCQAPVKRIVQAIHARHPGVPVVAFPRAIAGRVDHFAIDTAADAIGLDTNARIGDALDILPAHVVTQGNLDPLALIAGGDILDHAVDGILGAAEGRRHIFNLGHGILPQTPIGHVEQMLRRLRK